MTDKPAWTWDDFPGSYRPTGQHSHAQADKRTRQHQAVNAPAGEPGPEPIKTRRKFVPDETTPKKQRKVYIPVVHAGDRPRDPILVALCDAFTPGDIGLIIGEHIICASTLTKWQNGETKTPRIDTLRRVAERLNYDIRLERKANELKIVGAA